MLGSLKKIALALAVTFSAAIGMTVASGVAAPQPAEAGIVSSIKGAAKSVGSGIKTAAKATAGAAKVVTKRVIVPTGKDLYRLGKAATKPLAPTFSAIGSGLKKSWAPLKKGAKILFPVLR